MRPERSWRPIITLSIDDDHHHESTLGADGQCVNQKTAFLFPSSGSRQAHVGSRLDVNVWHRSQSKKKGKKRNLVASASHTLAELIKRTDDSAKLEIRLTCQSLRKNSLSSKGKPQNGAYMVLKLVPPSSVRSLAPKIDIEGPDGVISTATPSLVGTLSVPASPSTDRSSTWHDEQVELLHPPEPAGGTATTMVREPGLRKRRRTKGYALFSDEDCQTASISGSDSVVFEGGDGDEFIRWRKATDADGDLTFDEPLSVYDPEEGGQSLTGTLSPSPTLVESLGWLVSSILPQYIEKPEIAQVEQVQLPDWSASSGGGSALDRWSKRAFGFLESVLATFTMYSELSGARLDSQFEKVFERLQSEWTFTGGLLVALAAIDTAVFAIAPGSIFGVSRYAKSSIAASSIASGLGIACDAWFLMRYNWTDVHTFRKRALDVYGTYFFFALSARVPAFSMLLSSLALMVFMSIVAYDAWPEAVIVMSLLFGVVMSLQFLVFGAHWCAGRALWVVRWLWMGLFIGSRGLKTGLGGRGSVVDVGGENAREEVKVEVEIPPAYAHTAGEK